VAVIHASKISSIVAGVENNIMPFGRCTISREVDGDFVCVGQVIPSLVLPRHDP
jgi:hypothetical protein